MSAACTQKHPEIVPSAIFTLFQEQLVRWSGIVKSLKWKVKTTLKS